LHAFVEQDRQQSTEDVSEVAGEGDTEVVKQAYVCQQDQEDKYACLLQLSE
jgi:hypothetical protein